MAAPIAVNGGNWDAKGLSQHDLMIKDECILLDHDDRMIGHGSKYDTHVFSAENPRGILHRAFSVFLFNSEGKLLLQQRAAEKITFPNVWTNTCCSHPLHGYQPDEVDSAEATACGDVKGVFAAAVRKLKHELGLDFTGKFKYLTRLHYWAADVVTHGPQSPWGEHEIDYILFAQLDVVDIPLKPNSEEVKDVKYVTLDELRAQMDTSSGLLWSPWFRIIANEFLPHWWGDLKVTLNTDKYVDLKTIYRFDPTSEHMGGAGNAGTYLGTAKYAPANGANGSGNSKPRSPIRAADANNDKSLKQGAYGKVKIHKHSKLSQILRLDEVFAAVNLLYLSPNKSSVSHHNDDFIFCDDMLGKVSRSFASVIRSLPKGVCIDILVFYLALRALDTIEDDMQAFKGKEHEKIEHLNNFYRTALVTPGWKMDGVGEGDEKVLLQQYFRCVNVFKTLCPESQNVIQDIAKRMGQGMASYVSKDLGQGTVTVADYNLYCHYVAGLVGEGLSKLFVCTGYEKQIVADVSKTLANTMGLFLQKTNIIRDYLEDFVDGRAFWPQEIWKKYATKTQDLGELATPEARGRAVHCLNHLITDALSCVPECIAYMDLLKTEEVFQFCAIPQVMAIATLSELYDNPKVFTGVVKIRKGQAALLIQDVNSVEGLHKWFHHFAESILRRVTVKDPNASATVEICQRIIALTKERASVGTMDTYMNVATKMTAVSASIATVQHYFNPASSFVSRLLSAYNSNANNSAVYLKVGGVAVVSVLLGYKILKMTRKGLNKAAMTGIGSGNVLFQKKSE
jgi:farnesyl-diphosphate farnesyltransferase